MNKPIGDTVRERAARDPEFRDRLLKEAIEFLKFDMPEAASLLIHNCISPDTKETNDE